MHAAYIASSFFDYAAYGQSLGDFGAAGASIQYFSAGSIAQTQNYQSLGSFNPYDLAVSLGYAYTVKDVGLEVLDGFSLGFAAKYIRSEIATAASAEAVDLGVLSPAYLDDRLRLALTADNLGTSLTFDQVSEPLPFALKTGGAFQVTKEWLTTVDVGFPQGSYPYFAVGTEYWLMDGQSWRLALRAGYSSYTLNSIDGFSGASIGFGLGNKNLEMDYAFVPYGGLGQAQRISLSCHFGGKKSQTAAAQLHSPYP
jgi:hypothetical protein